MGRERRAYTEQTELIDRRARAQTHARTADVDACARLTGAAHTTAARAIDSVLLGGRGVPGNAAMSRRRGWGSRGLAFDDRTFTTRVVAAVRDRFAGTAPALVGERLHPRARQGDHDPRRPKR